MVTRRAFLGTLASVAGCAALGTSHADFGYGPQRPRRRKIYFLDDTDAPQGARLDDFKAALAGVDLLPLRAEMVSVQMRGRDASEIGGRIDAARADGAAAFATASTDIAMRAAPLLADLPLVAAIAGDPERIGLDSAHGRRRHNVTGFTYDIPTDIKALELLRDAFPAARRIAVVADQAWIESRQPWDMLAAGATLKQRIELVIAPTPWQMSSQIHRLHPSRVDACYIPRSDVLFYSLGLIVDTLVRHRLPNIAQTESSLRAGALMSYGALGQSHWQSMAMMLSLVLSGVAAQEIPFERPREFVLALNLGQASRMGIRIPKKILQRANLIL
jgi:putative tryptophan/tyrosine transport system substrate-binding protein